MACSRFQLRSSIFLNGLIVGLNAEHCAMPFHATLRVLM